MLEQVLLEREAESAGTAQDRRCIARNLDAAQAASRLAAR